MDIVSTKSVASLLKVSEATVKRWADAGLLRCFRTQGGHRKFRMRDVRAFLDDEPPPAAEAPAPSPAAESVEPPSEAAQEAARLALAADAEGVVRLAIRARDGGTNGFAPVFDRVLAPALRIIGERWTAGAITIAQEHIASNAVGEALARLRPLAEASPAPRAARPTALCACLGEEHHDLAVRMVAVVLAERGYDARLVGGHVPAIDLARLVAHERPALVALSASASADGESLRGDLAVIASAATTARAKVVVGGAGFGKLDRVPLVVARYARIADFGA